MEEIRTGDFVKFRIQDGENSERVWGEIVSTNIEKQTLIARIDNHPISAAFKYNEEIEMPIGFVLDVMRKNTTPEQEGQE